MVVIFYFHSLPQKFIEFSANQFSVDLETLQQILVSKESLHFNRLFSVCRYLKNISKLMKNSLKVAYFL